MKLINGLIERLALASTLFTVAFLALVSPRAVCRMMVNDLTELMKDGFGEGHPSGFADSPPRGIGTQAHGESNNGQTMKPEPEPNG